MSKSVNALRTQPTTSRNQSFCHELGLLMKQLNLFETD